MGGFCECASITNGNTGTSNAALQLKRPNCYYFTPKKANDGTNNVILSTDFVDGVLPAAFIEGKINHIDPSKRWYPVPDIVVNTNERAAPEQQTFDGGRNSQNTAEGLRAVSIEVVDKNAKYKKNLDRLLCKYPELAFFEIDECGNVGGEEDAIDSTIFKPHPIAKRTFYTNLTKAQGTTPQTLVITFEYDQISSDANECIIPASALGLNLCEQEGLLNLLVDYSSITNTTFTAALTLEYGGFKGGGVAQTDLLVGDFKLTDTTTGLPVALVSVTEAPGGTYAFTSDAMVATNKMQLQIADNGTSYTKKGFEVVTETFDAVA